MIVDRVLTPEERARTVLIVRIACYCGPLGMCGPHFKVRDAIRAAVAEEREACAALAETINDCCECGDNACHVGKLCPTAKAIRARP